MEKFTSLTFRASKIPCKKKNLTVKFLFLHLFLLYNSTDLSFDIGNLNTLQHENYFYFYFKMDLSFKFDLNFLYMLYFNLLSSSQLNFYTLSSLHFTVRNVKMLNDAVLVLLHLTLYLSSYDNILYTRKKKQNAIPLNNERVASAHS